MRIQEMQALFGLNDSEVMRLYKAAQSHGKLTKVE